MRKSKSAPKLSAEEERVVQRSALVDQLLNAQFQLSGVGTIFNMGQDCNPKYGDVMYALNRMWVLGYADQYDLMPEDVPVEKLGTGLTKEVTAWLVPLLISKVEQKVMGGTIDILSPSNHSLVFLMHVLGWYWHHSLGGPKPVVNQLLRRQKPQVVQNEALVCPLCFHQFKPSTRAKTQEAKMWEFVLWLPNHCVGYHYYRPPKLLLKFVTKQALVQREKFLEWYKSEKASWSK